MKFLKYLLIIVVAIVAIYFIAAIASPKVVEVTAEKEIEAPVDKVFMVVNDYNHYMNWNAWSKMEADEVSSVKGKGNEIGDVYSWEGDTIGKGQLEKMDFVKNESIHNHMTFFSPWDSEGEDLWKFESTENGTKVIWTTQSEPPLFMRPVMGMMLKPQLQMGLDNIAEYVDELPEPHFTELSIEEVDEMNYLGIKSNISTDAIGETLGECYGKLGQYCGENSIEMAGMPMAIYHEWNEDGTTLMEAAFPVMEVTEGNGEEIVGGTTAKTKALTTTHFGSYESTMMAHMAIDEYIKENNLEITGPVVEIYLNDPGEVAEHEIQTKIIYPVTEKVAE